MDVTQEETQEKKSHKPTDIGAWLVEARDKKNLSSQDIATQLNLTLSVITQIENNQFEEGIPPAFLRGYIRAYAQIVKVDVESICAEFDRQINTVSESVQNLKVVSSFKTRRKEINSSHFIFKLITFLIVIGLLSLAGWELWKRFSPQKDAESIQEISLTSKMKKEGRGVTSAENTIDLSSKNNKTAESIPLDSTLQDEIDSSSQDNSDLSENITNLDDAEIEATNKEGVDNADLNTETSTELTQATNNDLSDEQTVQSEQVSTGNNKTQELITEPVADMTFRFADDCWVHIKDANDETLAVGVKKAGRVMSIKGVLPVSVVLGEPSGVSLEFQGEAYDLSQFRAGQRAQFTLQ